MKFNYKLTRLCGTSYGPNPSNLLFDSKGTTIISPVYNRIQTVNLLTHTTRTLPLETRSNIRTISLSPDDRLLIVVDENNYALLVNYHRGVILHRFHFKKPAKVIKFSPNSLYFAISHEKNVQVWHSPTLRREFSPLILQKTLTGLHSEITSIEWSEDGSLILATSMDNSARMWSLEKIPNYIPVTFSGHKQPILGAYFSKATRSDGKCDSIYTVSEDGTLCHWKFVNDDNEEDNIDGNASSNNAIDFFTGKASASSSSNLLGSESSMALEITKGKWTLQKKHYLDQGSASVTATSFSASQNMLTVSFSSGTFGLYELPDCSNIHSLSISSHSIRTATMNNTAEWLAFGVPEANQLLVWEWRSESYILKQQGHAYGMRCMAYSPDSVCIATGGEDGKVKLWNTTSGFSFVTLPSEHTAPVTALSFAKSTVLLSAGLDGVVKAYDLMRYRHFRTFTSPTPVQFVSLDIDISGEIVVAGSTDPFQIFVWNLQTGKILDILSGHKGPVVEVQFHPAQGMLASASWDGTVKIWDLFAEKATQGGESLEHTSEVVCLAWRPDGKAICTGMLSGLLQFWEIENMTLMGEIHGQRDISGGRKHNDRMTADNNSSSRYFTSVCYSADGACVLAGGNSKYICIYEVSQQILLKKFQISSNRSLDGILDELHSKDLGDGGPLGLVDASMNKFHLPGAKRMDDGSRKSIQEVLTHQVTFSSTGREFAAISTEGLHIYSLDEDMIFDPIGLTETISPSTALGQLKKKNFGTALRMSLHLNEAGFIRQILEETPFNSIPHVVRGVGQEQLERLLQFIAKAMADSPHLEFYVEWCLQIISSHGIFLQKHRVRFMRAFRALYRVMSLRFNELKGMCDQNKYTLQFVEEHGRLTTEEIMMDA